MKFTIYIHEDNVFNFLEGKSVAFRLAQIDRKYMEVVIENRTLFVFTKYNIGTTATFNEIQIRNYHDQS